MSKTYAFFTLAALALAGTAAWMSVSTTKAPVVNAAPAPQLAATPAPAPAPIQTPTPAPAPKATAAAPAQMPAGTAGQQAFIDPKTGQLRPAEHDDVATLNAAKAGLRRQARTVQAEPEQFATEGGAMGVVVPDELQPYTVATKAPDGGIAIEHVTGGKAAAAKVRANSAKKGGLVQRKGEPNDR